METRQRESGHPLPAQMPARPHRQGQAQAHAQAQGPAPHQHQHQPHHRDQTNQPQLPHQYRSDPPQLPSEESPSASAISSLARAANPRPSPPLFTHDPLPVPQGRGPGPSPAMESERRDLFSTDADYLRRPASGLPDADSAIPYTNLQTPMDPHPHPHQPPNPKRPFPRDSQPAPKFQPREESMRSLDESSEDSYDNGETGTDKMEDFPNDLGWFHATVKVQNAIQWRNNATIQIFMLGSFVVGLLATLTMADNKAHVSVGLVCGSIITVLSAGSIMYTFLARKTWKKHPNPLIFFRSLCDTGLVLVLLIPHLYKCSQGKCGAQVSGNSCTTAAGFTQFFLWSSESWFFVMAIDMFYSLKSPFTDYKQNVRRYHMFVWISALLTTLLLVAIPGYAGQSDFGFCWTLSKSVEAGNSNVTIATTKPPSRWVVHEDASASDSDDNTGTLWKFNSQSWTLFYIWLLCCWVYAILVIRLAWRRFSSGVSETLRLRLRVLHSVTLYVVAIIIYWCLTFAVYVPYLIKADGQRSRQLIQLLNFMIACKGYFDFVIWFQMNEVSEPSTRANAKQEDMDVDVDLSPQVNLALRCEVLYYTTTGIIQAVKDTAKLPPNATQQELYLPPQGTEDNRGSLGVDEYMIRNKPKAALEKGTLFTDYHPHAFQTIREHFGVDSTQYIESLTRTTKERLSEGASGAFMFFSLDQQLIVKSMSDEESAFLRSIASDYCAYLLTNPDSLLTRFYGCHAIRLYGNTFNFVVMANLFSNDNVIHRRYDIKGSWVNRSASHPSKGKRVTCRHCNAKFVFGADELCRERVGMHEPNVVLKDNDLTSRVRLDPHVAGELYAQLVKDANFLANRGIMDYSLLLGVHNVEYTVNAEGDEDPIPETFKDRDSQLHRRPGKHQLHEDQFAPAPPLQGLPRTCTGTRRANRVVGPSIYYFGVIDILQQWNMNKRMERFAKTKLMGKDADGLSAVPPMVYCRRFKRKMAEMLSISASDDGLDHSYDPHQSRFGASQQGFI